MREWSVRDRSGGGASSASVGGRERRPSGVSSHIGGGGGDKGDSESDYGGGGTGTVHDDDAGSVGSSATSSAAGAAGGGPVEVDLDATGAVNAAAVRPFRSRRLEVVTNAYKLPATTTLLLPVQTRLPPAMSLGLACGVDVLPGAASGFGIAGAPSSLAAASIDGGGMAAAAVASGALPASATGSVVSIANSMFACVMARLPYSHFAIAASQPFLMPRPPHAEGDRLRLDAATGAGDGSTNPFSAAVPMHSPAWVAALLTEGLGPQWSRLPIPLSPRLPSKSHTSPSASASASVDASPSIADAIADVAQVAFTASTWAGSVIALFFTAMLVPATGTGGGAPVLGVWQLSVQVRCDDPRTRAALAAEMPDFVSQATCGRFVPVTHGNAPAPVSLLQQLDVFIARAMDASDPTATADGSSSSIAVAHQAASVGNSLGIGLMPLIASAATSELRSAGALQSSTAYNALGSSIFNVVPEDLLSALLRQNSSLAEAPHGGEDGDDGGSDDGAPADPDAYAALQAHEECYEVGGEGDGLEVRSGAAFGLGGTGGPVTGLTSMRLDDFFGGSGPGPATAAPVASGSGGVGSSSVDKQANGSGGFDPFL